MFVDETKPSLEELEHFGVKGMKWGVRKNRSSSGSNQPRFSRKQKIAAASVTAVGGAAVAAYVIRRHGRVKVSAKTASTTHKLGKEAADALRQSNEAWKKSVNDISRQIAEANASQDAWLRSMGIGAAQRARFD